MEKWISVQPQAANIPQLETVRGIGVQVFASPHDIPVAVKGEFDHGCDRFVIEFRYVDDDSSKLVLEQSGDGIVLIYKGASSGRVERIEVDVKKKQAAEVTLNLLVRSSMDLVEQVERSLRQLGDSERSLSSRLNYLAVSEALEQSKDMLATA